MARLAHLRAMETFEAVGRLGSVIAAASELGVSAGAISQQIRKLEAHLGLTLLERQGRGLVLTRWGRQYHDDLTCGFATLSGAERALRASREGAAIVVSGLPTPASKWLGRALFDWAQDNPDSPVRLVSAEDGEAEAASGACDFRMGFGSPGRGGGAVLFTDAVVPACAPSLLARFGGSVSWVAALLSLPRLEIAWGARYDRFVPPGWTAWARLHGAALSEHGAASLSFAHSASAIDAAVAGRGVVLGQIAMMQDELASGRLVVPLDLRLPLSAPYALSWSRAALDQPCGVRLRDWLLARGRRQQEALGASGLACEPINRGGGR